MGSAHNSSDAALKTETLFRSQLFAQVASLACYQQALAHYELVRNVVFLSYFLARIRNRVCLSSLMSLSLSVSLSLSLSLSLL
jgi:hypothetical protein